MSRKPRKVSTCKADRAALARLAALAISRKALRETHLPMCASSDLHPYGYTVRHWIRPGVKESEVLEYNPRLSDLPRLTAGDHATQIAIHRALGLNVTPSGEPWVDYQQRGLFDEYLMKEPREGQTHATKAV